MFGQKGFSQQRDLAGGAAEAGVGGVPMLTLVRHLTLINANRISTGVAILGVHGFETPAAEGAAIPHDVSLAPQLRVAFEAAEMSHVPTSSFGFSAFIRENDFVTSCTTRLQYLCMVSSTKHIAVFMEVNEIYE